MTKYSTSVVTETRKQWEILFEQRKFRLCSIIDCCMLDNDLVLKLCDVILVYDVETLSDHKPLLMTFHSSFHFCVDSGGGVKYAM